LQRGPHQGAEGAGTAKAKAVADEAVAKATAKAVTVVGKAKGTALAGSSEAAARRSAGMRVRLV